MPRKTAVTLPYTVMPLACDVLQVDTGIQPRLTLNRETVETYATLYQEAEDGQEPLPPLDVFQVEGAYYVADGFHRLAAALQASREIVPCHVYVGTRRDALVHAAFVNLKRGLPYNHGDKQQVLERLLADPEVGARGDRPLARDLGISHMTVWRTRARLAEEARLQAEIAALPATATAPKAREQEQLAAYLDVPVDTIKHSLGTGVLRYESPQAIIKDLARHTAVHGTPAPQAVAYMARNVERAAYLATAPPRTPPRPSQSKAVAAARQAEARREKCYEALDRALYHLAALYPFSEEELESNPHSSVGVINRVPRPHPTPEEFVATVLPQDAEHIAQHLMWARAVLEALWSAWEVRMQETAASV